jgi:guanylate kinase
MKPLLIIVSAPSGAGKTTLCERLLAACDWIQYSVSCTTRQPRGREVNGVNYEFVDSAQFASYVEQDDFLEHAVVHGFQYGTRRSPVLAALQQGKSILMDIDVQGAAQIRDAARREGGLLGDAFIDVFIEPPSLEVLRERLSGRGEDAPEVIEKRMTNAIEEMQSAEDYAHHIVNANIDDAAAAFERLVCDCAKVTCTD